MNDSTTTSRGAARRAGALAAFGVLLGIASVAVPAGDHRVGNGYGGSAPTVVAILSAVAQLGVVGLGCFVAYRRPQNPVGWLLAVGGCTFELDDLMVSYASFARTHALPGANLTLALEQFMWIASVGLATIFIGLLFPTGRLLSPRWRWVARAAAVGLVLAYVANTLDTDPTVYNAPGSVNPLRPSGTGLAIVDILSDSFLLLPLSAIAAVVALVVRYRRGSGEERHQIRIVMFAASLYALTFATDLVIHLITGHGVTWLEDAALIGAFAIPVGAGIAVLKYRLYDIDIVISRTLVYGSLGVFITAVYVAIVVGIGTLIGSGGRPNLGLSIAATAIVAVAFQPVRERLQRVANRLVYGERATPYEVLSRFSERVAESYASDEVLPRMARVLAEGTGAVQASVWLCIEDMVHEAAAWPNPTTGTARARLLDGALPDLPGADRAVPVQHQGVLLGALTVAKGRGESLTPIEEKLLADLASQAGLVLKNVGLTDELLQRLNDLRASRQRLVAAQDDERRRLERNLHDGAQQNLVALKVKIGLAKLFVDRDIDKVRTLLSELGADADEALDTLRSLARGIYPPLLADRGLKAALESQARKATLSVEVLAEGLGRYPPEIESAVYFCCLEALQNVQKYAEAKLVTVTLSGADGELAFEVSDDGKGFDAALVQRGAGLTNMYDRVDALGGTLDVSSSTERGTRIIGSLPARVAVAA
jgi:signal transduction histidine kinase